MHFLDPFVQAPTSRSKLGATLSRLHRHLEANRQRDVQALKVFEEWEALRVSHDETIIRQLDRLNQELSELSTTAVPVPHLSLITELIDEEFPEVAGEEIVTNDHAEDDSDCGIISSPDAPWHGA